MLVSRREHAKKWQGELIAAIGESLTKYNEAQDGLLKTHLGTVQDSLETAHTERTESSKSRITSLDELQRDAASHRIRVDEKAEVVRKAADTASSVSIAWTSTCIVADWIISTDNDEWRIHYGARDPEEEDLHGECCVGSEWRYGLKSNGSTVALREM